MESIDPRDTIILCLSERLYICSRLLTAAAERLGWDTDAMRELSQRLDKSIKDTNHASIETNID